MKVRIRLGDRKRATVSEINAIMEVYLNRGGEAITIQEGVLGYGLMVIHAPGLKSVVVKERYLNCWSSVHQVSFWNKLPKKYQVLLEKASA